MRIHLIAIGGAAMHNMAIALKSNHHTVTGSDDEIYNPSKERLSRHGLLPQKMGWNPDNITSDIDAIILGMHARIDNPELKRAQKMGLKIYSYPEFIYHHSKQKKRIVVAGSHGKTTTTSIILQVLKSNNVDCDYLVGAQLEGFDSMVRLSDAPMIILEGDEYLSSPIDRRPKILHYKPHISIITGIAWDHINVFPTFENYKEQFAKYISMIEKNGSLFFYKNDKHLQSILKQKKYKLDIQAYEAFPSVQKKNKTYLLNADNKPHAIGMFGQHNLENIQAAYLVCKKIGLTDEQFFQPLKKFTGAAKRLQLLSKNKTCHAFLDFAHAPSKVGATIKALKEQYPKRKLVAFLELHTYSSLNKKFLKHYKNKMNAADKAVVFYSEHTLKMKKLPPISKEQVKKAFNHPNMEVIISNEKIPTILNRFKWEDKNLLMMTSGTFGGMDLKKLAKKYV